MLPPYSKAARRAGSLIKLERLIGRPRAMVPRFWQFIDEQLDAEHVQMCRLAYKEIMEGGYKDALAVWCKARKNRGLCKPETKPVQDMYQVIVAHVQDAYGKNVQRVMEFLIGADGWVIASALATDGFVVTSENVRANKSKIKVPTVAKVFDVRCLNTPEMLRELGANFAPNK